MIDARMMARKLLLGSAYWSGASALAKPCLARAGAILMLHRITSRSSSPLGVNDHLSVTPDFLDALLGDLTARGHTFVSMDELLEALAKGRSRNLIAITADDGWIDNFNEGLPVFEAHDAPFCIYIAPGLTGGSVAPWWEMLDEFVHGRDRVTFPAPDGPVTMDCPDLASKRAAVDRLIGFLLSQVAEADQQAWLRDIGAIPAPYDPAERFMNWDEIRAIHAHRLGAIGAHTIHHYNLKRLDADAVAREMHLSADVIEAETGARPRHFAFPYGSKTAAGAREMVLAREAGFASAVTTRHGVLHSGHAAHLHALPRVSVNGYYQRLPYVQALLSGLITPLANGGKRLVTV
jgi:peptidoglycan/xylan/chitin deacetylase (PgdA/CDA1 family)